MAKVKSPLKSARLDLDLSRSELACLVYLSDRIQRAELAQEIALCEAGLREPDSPALRFLFQKLSKRGYQDLQARQEDWINSRKAELERT